MKPKKTTAWAIVSPEGKILPETVSRLKELSWKCVGVFQGEVNNKIQLGYKAIKVSITPL